jgi:hypothetical protein
VLDHTLPEVQQLAFALMGQLGDTDLHELLALLDRVHAAIAELPAELPHAERHRPKHLDRTT